METRVFEWIEKKKHRGETLDGLVAVLSFDEGKEAVYKAVDWLLANDMIVRKAGVFYVKP